MLTNFQHRFIALVVEVVQIKTLTEQKKIRFGKSLGSISFDNTQSTYYVDAIEKYPQGTIIESRQSVVQ